ncbi:hypothetical protein B0T19DRAFT_188726 [Cercophora scortea]|uniref:Uncharacterized protein n=1 Tax=Cercophora scortea TaxID=314031 RepID=A0AAE0INC2_9PEZI|nr:hypothetical protein B0T19DRAFT_188726 [Cercophora scortea]
MSLFAVFATAGGMCVSGNEVVLSLVLPCASSSAASLHEQGREDAEAPASESPISPSWMMMKSVESWEGWGESRGGRCPWIASRATMTDAGSRTHWGRRPAGMAAGSRPAMFAGPGARTCRSACTDVPTWCTWATWCCCFFICLCFWLVVWLVGWLVGGVFKLHSRGGV